MRRKQRPTNEQKRPTNEQKRPTNEQKRPTNLVAAINAEETEAQEKKALSTKTKNLLFFSGHQCGEKKGARGGAREGGVSAVQASVPVYAGFAGIGNFHGKALAHELAPIAEQGGGGAFASGCCG